MKIPFTKAHGAQNDFLLTQAADVTSGDLPGIARAICHRHTGVGADGWLVVSPGTSEYDCAIRLFNSDGSEPEISGNGTRCAGAFVLRNGLAASPEPKEVRVMTGAGLKWMRVLERGDYSYLLEMNMGRPTIGSDDLKRTLTTSRGPIEATLIYVGNPQCAVFVDDFDFDWAGLGAELEVHPHFPNRTNVSFVKVVDRHTVDVRFFERGVGVTMSSGTGSTGAAMAALLRGLAESPVRILTKAGPLDLRLEGEDPYLTGPAEITVDGSYYWNAG